MTPDEYLGWLTDMRDSQQLVEKAGTAAGLNRARSQPAVRGRRPQVQQIDDRTFRVHGVANRAAIADAMERATADDLEKRLRG